MAIILVKAKVPLIDLQDQPGAGMELDLALIAGVVGALFAGPGGLSLNRVSGVDARWARPFAGRASWRRPDRKLPSHRAPGKAPGFVSVRSAARDGGQDLDLLAVRDGRVEAVGEADVLPVDVDVDEAPQAAVAVREAVAELAVAVEQRVQDLADGAAGDLELTRAAGGGAQLRRDLDLHGHQARTPAASTCSTNSS
jgi:hypothetical protein